MATGDPEVRVIVPLRSTCSTKVTERNGVVLMRVGQFLSSRVTLEIDDLRAVEKLRGALDQVEKLLTSKPRKRRS